MKVWRSFGAGFEDFMTPSVVTMGVFDGVHLGHQQLMRAAKEGSKEKGLACLLVTFEPHPASVLAPDKKPKLLTTLDQRLRLFESFGIDGAWIIPFSRNFSELTPQLFLDQLEARLKPVDLHVGRSFRFGRDRKGDNTTLKGWGLQIGCALHFHAIKAFDGGNLSSTRIRLALNSGNVLEASQLLGRPFELTGVVIEGDRRGRHLGFPTANLQMEQELLPENGVYVTSVLGPNFKTPHLGLTNIGEKPTFHGQCLTVETFLPEFHGDLYGSRLELSFLDRLRAEEKFAGLAELRIQIEKDVEAGKNWWNARNLSR